MTEFSEIDRELFDEVSIYNNCLLKVSRELLVLRYIRYMNCGIMTPEPEIMGDRIKMPINDVMHLFGTDFGDTTKAFPFYDFDMEVGTFRLEDHPTRRVRHLSVTDFVSFSLTRDGADMIKNQLIARNGGRNSHTLTTMQFGILANLVGPSLSIENLNMRTPFIENSIFLAK